MYVSTLYQRFEYDKVTELRDEKLVKGRLQNIVTATGLRKTTEEEAAREIEFGLIQC